MQDEASMGWNAGAATPGISVRGQTYPLSNDPADPAAPVVSNFYGTGPDPSTCFSVTVTKYYDPSLPAPFATYIASRGYNTPSGNDGTCLDTPNPQRVERGLEVYY